jgi:hypothetical protein
MTQGVNDDVSISLRIKKTQAPCCTVKYYISGVYTYMSCTCSTFCHYTVVVLSTTIGWYIILLILKYLNI